MTDLYDMANASSKPLVTRSIHNHCNLLMKARTGLGSRVAQRTSESHGSQPRDLGASPAALRLAVARSQHLP